MVKPVYAQRVAPTRPVDFDELLRALGAADAEPPPLIKKLLAEVTPPADEAAAGQDARDALEAWLAVLDDRRAERARLR
jgi:hypothetical protein